MNRTEKEKAVIRKKGGRKWYKSLLRSPLFRMAVSIGLLLIILSRLNLRDLGETLARVDPALLTLSGVIFLVANMVSVFKWRIVIRAQQQEQSSAKRHISYFYLTSLFYIGLFFSNFLPTNFGGDFIKAWKLGKATGLPAEAAGSVVADRVSSTIALLMMAIVPALIEVRLLGNGIAIMVIAMFIVSLVMVGLFVSERAARKLGRFPVLRADYYGLRKHLKSFYYSLYDLRKRPYTLVAVMLISIVYQGLAVMQVYVLALSLGIHVSLIYFFLIFPVVIAVGMIPVSLNGIGVREGATVFLFGQVGVPATEAFSMSLLGLLVITVISLAGGVFYLFDRAAPIAGEENGTV